MHSRRWWMAVAAMAQLMAISFAIRAHSSTDRGSLDKSELCSLAASGHLEEMRWPDFSDYRDRVATFYRRGECAPAWIAGAQPTRQALEMIHLFGHTEEKGLDANDYDGPKWASRLSGLSGGPGANAIGFNAAGGADHFDLALTVTAMRYVSDIHFGRFNPGVFHTTSGPDSEIGDLPSFIRRLTGAPDAIALMETIEPPFPGYRRAEAALQHYLTLARDNPDEVLPVARPAVLRGGSYPALDQLARKLRLLGDLPPGESVPTAPAAYDGALVKAVRSFQSRHGLPSDGRLDAATFAQLNTPLRVRIRQLQLTLERWRWAPHQFPRPPIVVNIPEFELRALNGSFTTDLEMKVVVGKAYGHQTPIFAGELQTVIFRPYWDVPWSIERAELLPKVEGDSSYLSRNGYEVVTAQGKVVAPYTVTPALSNEIRSGALRIRQKPGPKNALGLIKFIFPNGHNVYLHGTPETELFLQTRRDFSHGCIRVEDPEKLANWALRGKPEWTPERIRGAMNGDATINVSVERPIPVLIVYATALALEGGEVRFFADIYGQDAQIEALAAKGYPWQPWRPSTRTAAGDAED